MKPRPKPKPRPETLIVLLILSIHFSCGLCIRHFMSSHLGDTPLTTMKTTKNSEHDVNAHVTDYDASSDDEVTSPPPGYHPTRVSAMDESQVWSLIDEIVSKRNRIRRHRDSNSTHETRKEKRRHQKLLLKSRNHSTYLQEGVHNKKGRKPHRRDFILKSDSEAHIITSASEIKNDWCHTIPLNLTVEAPNCIPKVISNHFCYGHCNSFFIPRVSQTAKGAVFHSYANCKPDRYYWSNVTLDCPDRIPPVVQKTIIIVESCKCIVTDEPNDDLLNKNIRHYTKHLRRRPKKRT